jgi:hypothetical protein
MSKKLVKCFSLICLIAILFTLSSISSYAQDAENYSYMPYTIKDGTNKVVFCESTITYYPSNGEYFHTVIDLYFFQNYFYETINQHYEYTTHFQSNPEGVGMYVSTEIYNGNIYRADTHVVNNYYTDYTPYPYCDDICAVINYNTNHSQNGYSYAEIWNTLFARDNY